MYELAAPPPQRAYKTDRRYGRVGVVEKMPQGVWMTSEQIAAANNRDRLGVASHLSYAVSLGLLRKREHVCKCCQHTITQWWRV